jgi:hypothetical protein
LNFWFENKPSGNPGGPTSEIRDWSTVARWFIFKRKITLWVNYLGPWNGNVRCILLPFGIYVLWLFGTFYGHVVAIWFIFPRFGTLCKERSGNPELESEIISISQ